MVNSSLTTVLYTQNLFNLPTPHYLAVGSFSRSIGDNGVIQGVLLSWVYQDIWKQNISNMSLGKYRLNVKSTSFMACWGVAGHIKILAEVDCTKCGKKYEKSIEMYDTKIGESVDLLRCPCDEGTDAIVLKTEFKSWEPSGAADKGIQQAVVLSKTTIEAIGKVAAQAKKQGD